MVNDGNLGAPMLLERDGALAELAQWWTEVSRGDGRFVLVFGEAGIGKTAVVRELARRVSGRVLVGACDPLSTPHPLRPVVDIAPQIGGAVAAHVAAGDRVDLIFGALLADLAASLRPTLLVIEDAHWADAASLDLVRFLGRRIAGLRSMLLVTFRQDEVVTGHPLAITLGDLASSGAIRRLPLAPLSVDAVRQLASGTAIDASDLHRRSGGNPFFVTEALAEPATRLPTMVRDAVMARVVRLGADERAALEATAVLGARVRPAWVDAMVGTHDAVAPSLARGLLRANGELVAFRHELAREALIGAMSSAQRRTWHARALAVLAADPRARRAELAMLAHHAEAAADSVAAREHGLAAAREAVRLRAHRQAAEQFERVQRFFPPHDSRELAELLESHAHSRYLTEQAARAIELRVAAAEMWQRLGDRVRYGDNLRWLSRVSWFAGRTEDARDYARQAIQTLAAAPRGRELAAAYSNQAQLHMIADEEELAVTWGRKAIVLARRLGDVEIESHARNNVGTARCQAGDPSGLRELERSLALARQAHLDEHVARSLTNLASVLLTMRDLPRANVALADGLAHTKERDIDAYHFYLRGYQAIALLHAGRLAEAIEQSQQMLARANLMVISRTQPLMVIGSARARRGDPDVWPPLDEALALAEQTGQSKRIVPVRAARGEAAWLDGDLARARREVMAVLPDVRRLRRPWLAGELLFVLARSGERRTASAWLARPYLLYLRRRYAAAATAWAALGCPYEQAWSLAGDGSEAGLRAAFAVFERLGMLAAAARITERLRALGVRKIPRGRRAATRSNAAGLTARELQVLALIVEGLRNAEIGRRLFISPKTVDHHVSAILGKIDVGDRAAAARWYRQHAGPHRERG